MTFINLQYLTFIIFLLQYHYYYNYYITNKEIVYKTFDCFHFV
jgi:hypothetical protein